MGIQEKPGNTMKTIDEVNCPCSVNIIDFKFMAIDHKAHLLHTPCTKINKVILTKKKI